LQSFKNPFLSVVIAASGSQAIPALINQAFIYRAAIASYLAMTMFIKLYVI